MPFKLAGVPLFTSTAGLAVAALASLSMGAPPAPESTDVAQCCDSCCSSGCDDHAHADQDAIDQARAVIEAQTFFALPQEHRDAITAKLIASGQPIPSFTAQSAEPNEKLAGRDLPMTHKQFESAWALIGAWDVCTRDEYARFKPVHQRMVLAMCERLADGRIFMASPCFVPGTDPALVNTVSNIISFGRVNNPNPRFEQIGRWNGTALDPGPAQQGEPTILTYSFPPDGTFVASGVGEGAGINDLNAFFDGIYPDRATWRAIYDQVFARWAELGGNTYVLEPNDDGADLDFDENNPRVIDPNPGVSGVRGDLRMVGKAIDGNSGTLAYNFFPQVGDMVIDTADNFYTDLSGQSIRLRNILAHEHGHGMGQLHVCPIEQNKLMEPFISVAFDGPQFDDVLNAQRDYGDPNEPNDSAGAATPLGAFGIASSASVGSASPATVVTGTVTIDDDNDVDVYSLTITQNAELTATMTPRSFSYNAGPQDFFCDGSAPYNPLVFLNPVLELLNTDGTSVLETGNANVAGVAESVTRTLTPGTYYLRARGTNPNGDQIIAYTLDVQTDLPAFIGADVTIVGGLPTQIAPTQPETVTVTVVPNQDTLIGVPSLNFRPDGAPGFSSVDFVSVGGNTFEATLPGFECDDNPELFVSINTTVEGAQNFPEAGNVDAIVVSGGVLIVDDVETNDLSWTTENTATEGQWERGVPQNNGRDDPPADFDGSGQCWLTGQEVGDVNSDVDGGFTRLVSPAFDFSQGGTISYAYWAQDSVNPIGPEDGFFVEYTTNGSTWIEIRNYPTAGVWRTDTIDVTSEIGSPASLRIRFIALDGDPGNVLECGVDAISIDTAFCEDVTSNICIADFDNDGDVDLGDFGVFGAAFNSMTGDANYSAIADFDNDGDVDLGDFGVFGAEFGRTDCLP